MTQDTQTPAAPAVPLVSESEELNHSEREILDYIRARYSLLYIVSSEETRVEGVRCSSLPAGAI